MASADLKVTIDADAAKLEREIQRASRSMLAFEAAIRRADSQAAQLDQMLNEQRAQALNTLGRGMLAFGAATLAGLGLAAKAAIDWESAWAGVRKTVDGSDVELAKLEDELRNLTSILPASHREIAAVAEAAGQLGVATPDIAAFTRVMIDLGETTNLSADEAATAIAQMMNVMQTAPQDVDRLGAALVALGNNGASTERAIIEMAQRIAGAGAIIGLAEHEVLAIANALASVGIEAEAGGTAISTAMIKMASAVAEGGEAVQGFADVAGMSAEEFATAFATTPAQAIQSFVAGLGRIDTAGGNVFATLDDLGLGTIRTRDALLRLSGAGGLLSASLSDGSRAWEENTALVEEAEKRYDTTEAKIQIARNSLVELAIDVGAVVLPAIASLAEGAASIAEFFGGLPGPVKTVATVLALLVGAAAAAGGGFLLLAPRIAAARAQMQLLTASSPAAAAGMRAAGAATKALGVAGLVAGSVLALDSAFAALAGTSEEVKVGVGQATKELLDLGDGISGDLVGRVVEANRVLTDTPDIMGRFSLGFSTSSNTVRKASNDMQAGISAIDEALAGLVGSGEIELATASFTGLAREWEASGANVDELREKLPLYADALAGVDVQQRIATDSAAAETAAMEDLDAAIDAASEALSAYAEQQQRATDPVFAMISALEDVDAAQSGYNGAVEEFGQDSPQAEQAAVDLAKAVAGAEQAALDGELAYDDFRAKLKQWVAQGVLTQDQADVIAGRVDNARESAEAYEGDYAAELRAQVDQASLDRANAAIDAAARARAVFLNVATRIGSGGGGKGGVSQGGLITGPGTGTSDTAGVFRLSNREFVVKAAAVEHYGPAMLEAINSMQLSAILGTPAVPVGRSAAASAGGSSGEFTVENLNVQAWSERFSLRQIVDELALHGAG